MKTSFLVGLVLAALSCHARAGAEAANDQALRNSGAALYNTYCARCHGADGGDTTTYQGSKSLVNITQRLTSGEIIQKSRGFAAVELNGLQSAALIAHLETLGSYPRQELLVETEWVALHGKDAGVRLVDMRNAAAYNAGHIPGAVRLEEGPLRTSDDKDTYLPKPEVLASMLASAGISNNTHVVAYDDQGGRTAARLWYVLSAYGHQRFSIVNGGWSKWSAEKRPVSQDVPSIQQATYTPKLTPDLTCPSPQLLARNPSVVVLDTRSSAEYKAGRIPGAVNVDWQDNVTGPEKVFKPAAELKKMYEAKGVTPNKEIVTHCASGGRAAQSLFTLKLLGYPKVRIYYGSYSDYTTRPEAPIEK